MEEEAIFRSAEMSLIQIYLGTELSRNAVAALGKLGTVQFRDLNNNVNSFQRTYVKEIRKLDEYARQLRLIKAVIDKKKLAKIVQNDEFHYDDAQSTEPPSLVEMEEITSAIEVFATKITQLDESCDDLEKRRSDLLESRLVLSHTRDFVQSQYQNTGQGRGGHTRDRSRDSMAEFEVSDEAPLLMEQQDVEMGVPLASDPLQEIGALVTSAELVVAAVPTEQTATCERILWRVLRGNVALHRSTMTDIGKDLVVVYTHGSVLAKKCCQVLEAMGGKVYKDATLDPQAITRKIDEINERLEDVAQVLEHSQGALALELNLVCEQWEFWAAAIAKDKRLYAILNLCDFDNQRRSLIAEGWVPTSGVDTVRETIQRVAEQAAGADNATVVVNVLQTNRTPPTYFKTNKFTSAFQALVDAYGIATYRETNPALAAIITFPFMFALMFGDIGHGLLVALCATYLIVNERKLARKMTSDLAGMVFGGRYLILLMGLFSVYTGFCYNDIFSLALTIFPSGWKWPSEFQKGDAIEASQVGTYFIGLDPAWHGSDNGLIFMNSYKMKLSIVMGFCHMTYSLMHSLVNYRHFQSRVDIIGNFVPSFLFMQCIFGYLTWAIVYKWCIDWVKIEKPAPGLLNMLINMFLSPGTIDAPLYRGQAFVQLVLLAVALVCVPWLLLYKPLYLKKKNSAAKENGFQSLYAQENHASVSLLEENATDDDDLIITEVPEEHEEFDFGDIMIHQVIHTIEFCLNCVSHTASYLRLWALSLAHAQLSSVLWTMTISNAFDDSKPSAFTVIKAFLLFGMWFVLTVCILVMMEGTSAMLHSLRLHWVEAMSKFFEGEGYPYEPFNFKQLQM